MGAILISYFVGGFLRKMKSVKITGRGFAKMMGKVGKHMRQRITAFL
jgi:hypothetical protein